MIEEKWKRYKEITEVILIEIKRDAEIEHLMQSREDILKSIFNEEKEVEKAKRVYFESNLDKLDNELKEKLQEEMINVKNEMKKNINAKMANYTYANNINKINFFNKKI